MNPWERYGRFESGPKKPPPKHGIKMKKSGTTWWGLRWIEALHVVLRGDANRLARGRTYARAGRTHDLVVASGKVTAKVTGSRAQPYEVSIELNRLSEAIWQGAITGMAAKAQFSAELLAGEMPQQIDDVFKAAGASLFPKERSDLVTACTCPDWGDPCKHVAAAHYVLGEAFDRDPFLLLELRGKSKARVLTALKAARAGSPLEAHPAEGERGATPRTRKRQRTAKESAATEGSGVQGESPVPRVTLEALTAADYDKPREPLPSLQLSFGKPATHGAVLRQLGAPGGWSGDVSAVDLLAPIVQAAAERARRIALADVEGELSKDITNPRAPSSVMPSSMKKQARAQPSRVSPFAKRRPGKASASLASAKGRRKSKSSGAKRRPDR